MINEDCIVIKKNIKIGVWDKKSWNSEIQWILE